MRAPRTCTARRDSLAGFPGNKVRGRGGLLLKSSIVFSKEWSQFTIDITDLIRTSVFRYLYNSSIMNTFNEFTNGTSPYETKLSRAHGAHSRG